MRLFLRTAAAIFCFAVCAGLAPARAEADSVPSMAAAHPPADSGAAIDTGAPAGFLPEYTITVTARRLAGFVPGKTVVDEKSSEGRQDLPSVLQSVSGVTVRSLGGFGQYAEASIRGSTPNQVQVYLDGVPLNGSTGSTVDLSKIPLSSLQQITVYKSIPPIEYFGDNAGGVIDLATATKRNFGEATVEAGSFGYRAGAAQIARSAGPMDHRFSLTYGYADNDYPYLNTKGVTLGPASERNDTTKTMDNNFYSSFAVHYSNTWNFGPRRRLISQLSSNVTDQGIFYYPVADSNDGHIGKASFTLAETYETALDSAFSLSIRASGKTDNECFQRSRPFYLDASAERHEVSQPYGQIEALVHDTLGGRLFLTGVVSGSYNGYHLDNLYLPGDFLQPRYFRLGAKAGAEAALKVRNNIRARIGALYRYELDSTNGRFNTFHTFTDTGRSTAQGFPGGFAEVSYSPSSGFTLLTSLRYSSRSPGFLEKYSEGANYVGNDTLHPERRFEYNAGIALNRPAFSISASFFASETKDKIVFIGNGEHMFVPRNLDDVAGIGVECDISASPVKWLSLTNAGTLMSNTIRSSVAGWNGKQEPLLPNCTDEVGIRIHTEKFYLTHSVRFISAYFTASDNTDTVYHNPELNASLGFTPNAHFDFSMRLDNYLNVQDYNFPEAPTPGIRFYVVLKYLM